METQQLETWQIHCRVNVYMIEAITDAAFAADSPKKGRSFVEMFAHIHNVRLMWLKSAAPELLAGLQKIEKGQAVGRRDLQAALAASGKAMESMLQTAFATGKVKGFKPHASAFLGYLLAHEWYHHGEIGVELTRIGFSIDQKTSFGLWEWGVR